MTNSDCTPHAVVCLPGLPVGCICTLYGWEDNTRHAGHYWKVFLLIKVMANTQLRTRQSGRMIIHLWSTTVG